MCPICLCYRILLKLFTTGGHVVPVADGVPVDPEMLVSCLFVSFSPKLGNCWLGLVELSLDPRTVCSSRGAHMLLQVVCFSYPITYILHTPLLFLSWGYQEESGSSFWRSIGLWMWPKHGTDWKMDRKTDWVSTSRMPTTWLCYQVEFSSYRRPSVQ